MHTKELSKADLGLSGTHGTHIGLHKDMIKGWSEKDRVYNAYLFVSELPGPIACKGVINAITRDSGAIEAPKLKTGSGVPDEKNLLKLIRKYGSDKRKWLTIAQLPDDTLLVFLGTRPASVDSITEEAQPLELEETGSELTEFVERFAADSARCELRSDIHSIQRFTASLLSKRFVLLTGLAGSGKTKLAQALARWITPRLKASQSRPFLIGEEVIAPRSVYKIVDCDNLSVVVLQPGENTKTILPLALVEVWARVIEERSFTASTPSQEIQKAVADTTDWSPTINSFHSPLKALALHYQKAAAHSELESLCYAVVPVGADWTGNENILGYPDGLQVAQYVTKPALDLTIHAEKHKLIPHFLILDEMNLSHVERYFADILSIIESDENLELYPGDMERRETWRQASATKTIPPKLKQLPENLFIIGTVNVDETTHMFSPKVLDRANVIEFRMDSDELKGFLVNPARPDLAKLDGKGASFGEAFVKAAKRPVSIPSEVKAAYDAEILLFFKTLQAHGTEFGYRTAYDTARFIHFYKLLGNHAGGDTTWFPGAFDCVVFQKLLPKLHGSRAKLGPVLKKLWILCVTPRKFDEGTKEDRDKLIDDTLQAAKESKVEPLEKIPDGAPYPLSAEKIGRMWRLLIENGFTSFAEA